MIPESYTAITDPEAMEGIKNTTQIIRGFFDRNPDFPALYTQAQEIFDFCGFYDKSDVLGTNCPFSSQETCSNSTSIPLLDVFFKIFHTVFTVMTRNLILILVIEVVVFILLIVAYRSVSTKELKKVTPSPSSFSTDTTAPLMTEAKIENLPSITSPPIPKAVTAEQTIPGMPAVPNNGMYYYTQPLANQPAVPLNYQSTGL